MSMEKPGAAKIPTQSQAGVRNVSQDPVAGASSLTARKEHSRRKFEQLMEAVVERGNMFKALRQVEANKGSAGIDGVSVGDLRTCLREHWPRIREELLAGGPCERWKYPSREVRECDSPSYPIVVPML
jgi:RNA-directed DNA polymerase